MPAHSTCSRASKGDASRAVNSTSAINASPPSQSATPVMKHSAMASSAATSPKPRLFMLNGRLTASKAGRVAAATRPMAA